MTVSLEARSLGHRYGARVALEDVSFRLSSGVTALVGVNGAGKSTLLRALAGGQRPSAGTIHIDGHDPYRFRERKHALTAVALMPQVAQLPANMTVHEVVACVGWLKGMRWAQASRRAREVVEAVGLGDRSAMSLRTLSGGMARRVALAQALVTAPDVLLLDEPSTGLDPEQRPAMVDLIRRIESTVLFSSHVIEDVEDVAERVMVLDDGRLIYDGTLDTLRHRGAAVVTAGGRASLAEAGLLELLSESRAST
jgi:ABC-2 type transport system ATP-binding protein